MSRWKEEFEDHAIIQTLAEVRECLDVQVEEPSASLISEKRRLFKVLDFLDEAMSGLDPETVPIAVVNAINAHLRSPHFWNQVQAYKNNPDAPHLTNANVQIDSQLPAIYQLFSARQNKKILKLNKSVEKSFDDFAKTIEASSVQFREKITRLESELTNTASKQETLDSEMDQLATDHAEKLHEWDTENTTNHTDRSEAFSEAQTARNTEFEEWFAQFQKDASTKSEKLVETEGENLSEFFTKFQSDTDKMRQDAETRHKQILELHGLVAGDGVVASYVGNAESEKAQANLWRWLAIIFIAFTAIWLFFTYLFDVNSASDAGVILARMARIVPLTAVFLYGAVYASKQSSLHRNNEKQTRRFALEIKAIDPFIAALEPEQQKQLKMKLTEQLFGQNNVSQATGSANVDPNLLKVILDAFKDVATGK